jgi:hypothetical protein
MALDMKNEFAQLTKMYKDAETSKFNALIYGALGTGKTRLLKTARLPVFIDSFDPGGTKTLRTEIEAGKIFADTRWELESPKNPTVALAWEKEYERRKKEKFFDNIGTYCIDSVTTFSDCFANQFLKSAGRQGTFLFQADYNPIMAAISAALKDILSLPCDVIILAHDDVDKDEATGRMFVGPNFIGKSSRGKVPLWFDEIYCALTKSTSTGVEYQLLTQADGMYKARTRLGKEGIFDKYEKPDIKALLKKAGVNTDDKVLA